MEVGEDPVPVIGRAHFEEAMASARKSVSNVVIFAIHYSQDLRKFQEFAQKFDPTYAKAAGGAKKFKLDWPEDPKAKKVEKAEEDIYS